MFANTFTVLALALSVPAAFAKIFITQPVSSTVWPVGTTVTMAWQDDGSAPSLAAIGTSSLGIYAGNQIQQTLLQQVGTFNVSQQNNITFQINGDIGPNNQQVYFMRFTSQGLQDPTNPQYPEQAFSAMFAVTGSTGSFNASVQAEVNGASTAGAIGAAATPAAGSGTTPAAITSTVVVGVTPAASKTSSSAKASGSTKTGAASASNAAGTSLSTPAVLVAAAAFAAFFL